MTVGRVVIVSARDTKNSKVPTHMQKNGQMMLAWRARPNGHSNQFYAKAESKGVYEAGLSI